jgi:hypothetical protein
MAKSYLTLLALLGLLMTSPLEAATRLPVDTPSTVGDLEAVCTGVGLDSRQNPDWTVYPLKIEVAGQGGQYLGDTTLTLSQDGKELAAVKCDGPWILFRIPPGRYQLQAETEGKTIQSPAFVPTGGQGRIILRFPELGGRTSPLTQ